MTDFLDQDAAEFAAANPSKPPVPVAEQIPVPPPRTRAANPNRVHLLWTIPVATFLSLPVLFVAALARCGIYSCGWGGGSDRAWLSLIICGVIGVIWALAIAIPARELYVDRRLTAIVTGTVVTVLTFLLVLAAVH